MIILSKDEAESIEKWKLVLETASEYGLELNIKNCKFLNCEIDFWIYRIMNGKLYPFLLKTKAVMNFAELKYTKYI